VKFVEVHILFLVRACLYGDAQRLAFKQVGDSVLRPPIPPLIYS
jgi:hypothetical protein